MNRLEAFIGLNMVSGIGSRRLKRLLEFFGRPENIFKAAAEKLAAVSGIGSDIAAAIRSLKQADIGRELELVKKFGLDVFTLEDDAYPENLKNISGAPILLYVKGRILPQDQNGIAVVGSRRASFYGLGCAEKFSAGLSGRGFTVISGMARGIDTAAHKGALRSGGRTIAVIGSGFGRIYPPENMELAGRICRSGAVISEFPVNAEPLRQNFPRRNRLISGLSLGVLVVEAAENSGALITADFALEQGREVFALPGKVDAPNSSGTNGLIKQGAKLVSCVDDITEEFAPGQAAAEFSRAAAASCRLSPEESALYSFIACRKQVYIDDLARETDMDIPLLSRAIFGLEMKHLIRQLPGKRFVKNQ